MEIPAVKATQPPQPQRRESAPQAERVKEPQAQPVEAQRRPPVVNTQGQTTGRIVNTTA
ncbi:MAG: hypothetical protein IPO43_01480 [Rhodoferax sp.]|nr:hypothetical protein [Rhodoferax sp.]